MDTATSWEKQININHSSAKPLHMQVKEALEEWITNGLHDGTLNSGDRIPSENELSEKLEISPITVKRALDDLRRQGLIQRIQGRGSFITGQKRIVFQLTKLFSLTAYTRGQGMTPNRQTLELTEINASPSVAYHLDIPEKARVARLVRIRLMDRTPVAIETTHLPMHLLPNLLSEYREEASLYELLATRYKQEVVHADDTIEPVLINAEESKVLEVPVGSLGIMMERTAYNSKNEPLEFTKSVFRGDLCSFSIEMDKDKNESK